MSDILKGFFTGMEEFARTMREHASLAAEKSSATQELIDKVNDLTARVDKLVSLLENKLGATIEVTPVKGKRMMDIKQRILEAVSKHPEGVRPPLLARMLNTKVQNLYPHLKEAVNGKNLRRDESGTYFPAAADREAKPGNPRSEPKS
jgi:hypothetical protein